MALALLGVAQTPSITLAAAGDVMLGRYVSQRLMKEGVEKPWRSADPLLQGSEIRFANLECVLSDGPFRTENRFRLKVSPSLAKGLKGRWTVMSIANNHALDCGPEGLAATVKQLRAWGIEPIGLSGTPVVIERKGIRFGFLGYSEFRYPGIGDLKDWEKEVSELRPKVDVLVVSAHWGVELSTSPLPWQRAMASRMREHGVDVILGHHPHVLQPIEAVGGSVTAFSLGDFVFDSPAGPRRQTGLLKIRFSGAHVASTGMERAKIKNYFPVIPPGPDRSVGPSGARNQSRR